MTGFQALLLSRRSIVSTSAVRLMLLSPALIMPIAVRPAAAQYSTVEINKVSAFPPYAQTAVYNAPAFSTDGTWLAYTSGDAVWTQSIKGGALKRIFVKGTLLPGSEAKAKSIYPQTVVDNGIVIFIATDGGGGATGLFGLYSIKADGSEPAKRIADSTQTPGGTPGWYDFMNPEGVYGFFQVSKGVAVIGLEGGTLYAANVDGSDPRVLWQVVTPGGFAGCSSGGEYHDIFTVNQAFQPATDGKNYAFGAANFLDFAGLYEGPLSTVNACGDRIDSGDSINDPALKILPGQPTAGGAFAFPQGENFQIDGSYVYFGAYSANGVKSGEDYYGYFKVPLGGGKASVIVSNISHIPGIIDPKTKAFVQARLLGFAVRNGRFIFAAVDEAQNDPESFYMLEGTQYVKVFQSGTSVSDRCIGTLESGFADEATINQNSLTADGRLVFYAMDAPPTYPNLSGPCTYPQFDYIHLPIAFFVTDTTHRLLPTETEISLNAVAPIVYGERPSLKIQIKPVANPKNLVPTGTVTVYYTNPEYFGVQQPKSPSARLNADGEATIALGPQQIGTYSYVVSYGGDTNFAASGSTLLTFPLHVTAPRFSVPTGTYKSGQTVSLTDITPGSAIHYTTNGSTPTKSSPTFLNSIKLTKTTTIKAIATAAGDQPSIVSTAIYTIK